MFTRAALAAIDYNCNLDRQQARNKDGTLQYDLACNRAGKKWFVKPRKAPKDVSFRDTIARQILECVRHRRRPQVNIPVAGEEEFIRGKVERPDKATVVSQHQSRMAKYKT